MDLSKTKISDLQDLIFEAINSDFIYRDSLNLPKKLTFGLEIEYEECDIKYGKFLNSKASGYWRNTGDGSISFGGEVISPILRDKKEYWLELKKVCEILRKRNAATKEKTGGHIHIGADIIGDNYLKWIEFAKMYMYYENIIYRYSFGENIRGRKRIKEFARPIAGRLYNEFSRLEKATSIQGVCDKLFADDKYYSVNFDNLDCDTIAKFADKNTIEFRCPNGTINEKIWQNNVNTFSKMILAVLNNKVDTEYIDYQISKDSSFFGEDAYYNEICLEKALEFVDIIFEDDIDKIMFLKQYLKDFNSVYDIGYVKK